MKILGLITLVFSSHALSLDQRYPEQLLAMAQESICRPEESNLIRNLAQEMSARVQASFEKEAKVAELPIDKYLNKKETHEAFLATLINFTHEDNLKAMEGPEFMLLSLEMGLRFQIISTVRNPLFVCHRSSWCNLTERVAPHYQ